MAGPSLIATLGANISGFVRDLDTAKGHAKSAGQGIGSAFGSELGGKLAGLVTVGALEETIRRTIEYGSKVNDLAARLGISTTAVQEWDYALKQSGSSIEAATPFFEKLAIAREKVMKGGSGGAALAADFGKLGISVEQLKNSRIEDIAAQIAKAFESGDPQTLIASLRAVGGKGAGELVAAFREGLAGQLNEALVIDDEAIANLDRAGDAISRISHDLRALAAAPIAGGVGILDKAAAGWKAMLAGAKGLWEGGPNEGLMAAYNSIADYENRTEKEEQRRKDKGKNKGALVEEDLIAEKKAAQKEEDMILDAIEEDQKIQDKKAEASRKAVEASEAQAKKDAEDKFPALKETAFKSTSLQSIGGFLGQVGSLADPQLAVAKRSQEHLARIEKATATLVSRGNSTAGSILGDTEF